MDKKQLIELVELFKGGDESQFEKIYLATNNRLYNYIFSLSDSLNNDDCYELVQETYIQVARKIDTLNDTSKFMSWLFMIGRNKALRYLDKRKKEVLLSEEGEGVFEQEKETEYVPEEILDSKEKKRMILDIIEALPKDQKEAIYLRYYKGLSVKEISEKLSIKEGTVKSNLNYGRKKIKGEVELLEKKGTKLYGISSLPLLLLLLREAYGVQAMEGKVGANIYSNIAKECSNIGKSIGGQVVNGAKRGVFKGGAIKGIAAVVSVTAVVGGYAYFSGSDDSQSTNDTSKPTVEVEGEEEESTLTEDYISFTSYAIDVESMYKVIKNNNMFGYEDDVFEFDDIINIKLELIVDETGDRYYDYVYPMWLNDFIGSYIIEVENVIAFKEDINKLSKISKENSEIVEKCDEMIRYFINNQDKINKIAEKMSVIANFGDDSRAVEEANRFVKTFPKYLEKVEKLKSLL